MITIANKKDLRKEALSIRKDMAKKGITSDISFKILSKILNSKDFIDAKNIALYYPTKGEIDILGLLNVKNKNYFFPKCNGLNLEFVKYEKDFIVDEFNIPIPKGEIINPEIIDVIYVPALIANSKKYRLGYGKGFYDRFFENNNLKAKKVIVIAKKLINDDFIEDGNDIKCDEIISE